MNETRPVANAAFTIEADCTDRDFWNGYVQAHPSASNYHQYGWRDVIEGSFGHRCCYLTARENGSVAGVLPLVLMQSRLFGRFFISLPFFNYGGVLCNRQEVGERLLAEAVRLQTEIGAEYTELRHTERWSDKLPTKEHKVSMVLELAKDPEAAWQGFNAKLRNQIRKAMKSGLTVSVGGKELLADFYTVFVRNMRDLGTPVYSRNFFSHILTAFPERSRIIVVHLQEKPVAAGLINWFRETMEIPWASSNRKFNALCPNNLLYWTALQCAMAHGCRQFDFGRSSPGEGTFNFKKQWGALPIQLHWQYLLPEAAAMPELNNKNPRYKLAIKVWQKLPLPVTRFLGPRIVKNIP